MLQGSKPSPKIKFLAVSPKHQWQNWWWMHGRSSRIFLPSPNTNNLRVWTLKMLTDPEILPKIPSRLQRRKPWTSKASNGLLPKQIVTTLRTVKPSPRTTAFWCASIVIVDFWIFHWWTIKASKAMNTKWGGVLYYWFSCLFQSRNMSRSSSQRGTYKFPICIEPNGRLIKSGVWVQLHYNLQ